MKANTLAKFKKILELHGEEGKKLLNELEKENNEIQKIFQQNGNLQTENAKLKKQINLLQSKCDLTSIALTKATNKLQDLKDIENIKSELENRIDNIKKSHIKELEIKENQIKDKNNLIRYYENKIKENNKNSPILTNNCILERVG